MPPTVMRNSPEFNDILAKKAQEQQMGGTPVIPPAQEYPKGYDFKGLQDKVRFLSSKWKGRMDEAIKRRLLRMMEVNNDEERRKGRFKADEIYIPIHVIDDNISKEAPSYISFLTESKNSAIFKAQGVSQPVNFEPLERVFTSAVRYEGYEQDIFTVIDGFQLHGVDYLEVKYDDQKPGYFSFEQLGYENVWYPINVERNKLQLSPIIVRQCKVTKEELEAFPDVNQEQVDILFKDKLEDNPENLYVDIQKVYYRMKGIVNICWMKFDKSTDFVRAPKPLFLGRIKSVVDQFSGITISSDNIYESFYPIVPFPYAITENKQLCETMGRAKKDENVQEAVSSLVSSIVNSYHRASNVMWAPKNPTSTAQIEQLDLVIENGRGLSQPIDFFHMDYPDESGMGLVNGILTQNKSETSQINFAVGNRQDYASRKTAEEIKTAKQTSVKLGTTQIVLFSTAWREVMTMGFLIFKSQVEQGTIKLVDLDPSLLQYKLTILAAGEIEVVQRQETLVNLQNMWAIISQTPAAIPVLKDILRLMVPSYADKYIQAIEQGDPKNNLIQGLAMIITEIAKQHPEVIPPQSYEQLSVLLKEAQTIINPTQAQQQQTSGDNSASVTNEPGSSNRTGNIPVSNTATNIPTPTKQQGTAVAA